MVKRWSALQHSGHDPWNKGGGGGAHNFLKGGPEPE